MMRRPLSSHFKRSLSKFSDWAYRSRFPAKTARQAKDRLFSYLQKGRLEVLDYDVCVQKYGIFSKKSEILAEAAYFDFTALPPHGMSGPKEIKGEKGVVDLSILELKNAFIVRHVGIITSEGQMLHPYFCGQPDQADLVQYESDPDTHIINADVLSKLQKSAMHIFEEKCFYLMCRQNGHGHFILEVLPKLWARPHLKQEMKFLLYPNIKGYARCLEPFAASQAVVEMNAHILFCETLYVATQPLYLKKHFTKEAIDVWRTIGNHHTNRWPVNMGPKKVFISRSKISRRNLVDNDQVENIFKQNGFSIVNPEKMNDMLSQLRLFSGADIIAAPYGSAVFNCLFSQKSTPMFLITNDISFLEENILYFYGHRNISVYQGKPTNRAGEPIGEGTWSIPDLKDLREKIGAWLYKIENEGPENK